MVSLNFQRGLGIGADDQNVTDEVTANYRGFATIVGPISGVLVVGIIAFSLYLWCVFHPIYS
jgi:hypothetical protein